MTYIDPDVEHWRERTLKAEAEVDRLKEENNRFRATMELEVAAEATHDMAEEVIALQEKLAAHEKAMRSTYKWFKANHKPTMAAILRARLEEK